ncbi:hypothetical protein AB0J63_21420 [Streptosporangium canum]|uniref:hypothetical protein n=1 Tax=Streptosporangium canum TaxID=324952 RepID=UPI003440D477
MKPLSIAVTLVAAVFIVAIGLTLGPGASWWLEHVDGGVACSSGTDPKTVGVTCLSSKDRVAAVDSVRGRVLAAATGLAALLAVYYAARNAGTARRTFQLANAGMTLTAMAKPPSNSAMLRLPSGWQGSMRWSNLLRATPH